MAKRNTFEDLLHTDFRWPQDGDVPFIASEDWTQNATLAQENFTRFVLMTEGYKKAADLMVTQSVANSDDRNYLVFPIIFNYRHFIELSLKYMLSVYGPTVGVTANWNTHNLSDLWLDFSKVLDGYGTSDPDLADSVVEVVVAEFSKIDPRSFSLRYPVDTKGKPIPLGHEFLNLESLRDVMLAVGNYFTGCDGYLDNLQGAGP